LNFRDFRLSKANQNVWINDDYGRHDAQSQVVMVPEAIAKAMAWKTPAESGTTFERREIVRKRR